MSVNTNQSGLNAIFDFEYSVIQSYEKTSSTNAAVATNDREKLSQAEVDAAANTAQEQDKLIKKMRRKRRRNKNNPIKQMTAPFKGIEEFFVALGKTVAGQPGNAWALPKVMDMLQSAAMVTMVLIAFATADPMMLGMAVVMMTGATSLLKEGFVKGMELVGASPALANFLADAAVTVIMFAVTFCMVPSPVELEAAGEGGIEEVLGQENPEEAGPFEENENGNRNESNKSKARLKAGLTGAGSGLATLSSIGFSTDLAQYTKLSGMGALVLQMLMLVISVGLMYGAGTISYEADEAGLMSRASQQMSKIGIRDLGFAENVDIIVKGLGIVEGLLQITQGVIEISLQEKILTQYADIVKKGGFEKAEASVLEMVTNETNQEMEANQKNAEAQLRTFNTVMSDFGGFFKGYEAAAQALLKG